MDDFIRNNDRYSHTFFYFDSKDSQNEIKGFFCNLSSSHTHW